MSSSYNSPYTIALDADGNPIVGSVPINAQNQSPASMGQQVMENLNNLSVDPNNLPPTSLTSVIDPNALWNAAVNGTLPSVNSGGTDFITSVSNWISQNPSLALMAGIFIVILAMNPAPGLGNVRGRN